MMRFDHRMLRNKALLALEEVAENARRLPARRTFALRFTLAYLHAAGEGERWLFDQFWKAVTSPVDPIHDSMPSVCRLTSIESALNGIWRSVGIERDVGVMQTALDRVRKARQREEADV